MNENPRFVYDEVPYDTEANAEAHPAAMATLAHLCGLAAAPPSRARVLEIGCGNGENVLSAATYLPAAHFVGFDLAADAVAAGRAAAAASGIDNVELFVADIAELRSPRERTRERSTIPSGAFDYVIAHGMYSWIPETIRTELLGLMHDALGPRGVGFLSLNLLPGWELRSALRDLARHAIREREVGAAGAGESGTPAEKVGTTLRLVHDLGQASFGEGSSDFLRALSAAAREYAEHVARATPPDAPFSSYVFHDLLAECNDAFSVADLSRRLAASGLRIVCETPLLRGRGDGLGPLDEDGLAAELARTGAPFLQVLVQRTDAEPARAPDPARAAELELWADLAKSGGGALRTTTGATVRPDAEDGLARAARHAPGFVAVRDLGDDDDAVRRVGRQLFAGFCEGVFHLTTERPAGLLAGAAARPRVAGHVRARARAACERGAETVVVTNAIHRSFRVPWHELAIIQQLDGERDASTIARDLARVASSVPAALAGPLAKASARDLERFVATTLDRFGRYLFLVAADAWGKYD